MAWTLWERLPPASCDSTITPDPAPPRTRETIVAVPGSFQSRVSTVQPSGSMPSSAPISKAARFQAPNGARNHSGASPTTCCTTSLVRPISEAMPGRLSVGISGWVQVWLPMTWPSAAIRRSRSRFSVAISPQTKNMARTPYRARVSRIPGV